MYVRERSFRRRRRMLRVPTRCPLDRFILVTSMVRNLHYADSRHLCDYPLHISTAMNQVHSISVDISNIEPFNRAFCLDERGDGRLCSAIIPVNGFFDVGS